jgi:hypothetical protein
VRNEFLFLMANKRIGIEYAKSRRRNAIKGLINK